MLKVDERSRQFSFSKLRDYVENQRDKASVQLSQILPSVMRLGVDEIKYQLASQTTRSRVEDQVN